MKNLPKILSVCFGILVFCSLPSYAVQNIVPDPHTSYPIISPGLNPFYGIPTPNTIQYLTGTQTFTSDGRFVVPPGINFVQVEMWGGGGGSGYGATNLGSSPEAAAGGGGGGGYLRIIVQVRPGSTIPITVGAAGTTPLGDDGTPGGYSAFGNLLYAGGGKGGQMHSNGGKGGAGGSVSGSLFSYAGSKGEDGWSITSDYGTQYTAGQGGLSGFYHYYGGNPGDVEGNPDVQFPYGNGASAPGNFEPNVPAAQPGSVIVSW